MKYFEVQDTPELKYAPRLRNWYGKFDVRNICPEGYPRLPERELFFIEPSEKTMFTDIILSPFLLVSEMIREVLHMYREPCFFRDIILLDQSNGRSKMYYLPVLDETRRIQMYKKVYKNGICISEHRPSEYKPIQIDRNFFWIRGAKKRHIIISMDMAESLLRRNVAGLGLEEVELYDTFKEEIR